MEDVEDSLLPPRKPRRSYFWECSAEGIAASEKQFADWFRLKVVPLPIEVLSLICDNVYSADPSTTFPLDDLANCCLAFRNLYYAARPLLFRSLYFDFDYPAKDNNDVVLSSSGKYLLHYLCLSKLARKEPREVVIDFAPRSPAQRTSSHDPSEAAVTTLSHAIALFPSIHSISLLNVQDHLGDGEDLSEILTVVEGQQPTKLESLRVETSSFSRERTDLHLWEADEVLLQALFAKPRLRHLRLAGCFPAVTDATPPFPFQLDSFHLTFTLFDPSDRPYFSHLLASSSLSLTTLHVGVCERFFFAHEIGPSFLPNLSTFSLTYLKNGSYFTSFPDLSHLKVLSVAVTWVNDTRSNTFGPEKLPSTLALLSVSYPRLRDLWTVVNEAAERLSNLKMIRVGRRDPAAEVQFPAIPSLFVKEASPFTLLPLAKKCRARGIGLEVRGHKWCYWMVKQLS